MPACEKCWGDAYMRTLSDPTLSQAEHYQNLIKERKDNECTKAEQVFGRSCCLLEVEDRKQMTDQINAAIERMLNGTR